MMRRMGTQELTGKLLRPIRRYGYAPFILSAMICISFILIMLSGSETGYNIGLAIPHKGGDFLDAKIEKPVPKFIPKVPNNKNKPLINEHAVIEKVNETIVEEKKIEENIVDENIHTNKTDEPVEECPYLEEGWEGSEENCGIHKGTGIKFVSLKNVCIAHDRLALVVPTEDDRTELNRCCFEPDTYKLSQKMENCSLAVRNQCKGTRGKIGGTDFIVKIWTQEEYETHGLKTLGGNSFWMHTPTKKEHFGHLTNRFMQWLVVNSEEGMPKFDRIVTRQFRPVEPHMKAFADTIMKNNYTGHYFADDLQELKDSMVCMERAFEIEYAQQEFPLFTLEQGKRWRAFAKEHFAKFGYKPGNQKCPPTNVVVLQRTEGTGRRSILNYDVIDRVLSKQGLTYKNISVSGEDGTDKQIGAFNDFSLMITSHSSQLKNLLWAPRNAVVLEARGTPSGYMQPSPFSKGMEPLEIIFHETVDHKPDYASCPEKHGCRDRKKYKTDYWLNESIFEADLLKALAEQKKRCEKD